MVGAKVSTKIENMDVATVMVQEEEDEEEEAMEFIYTSTFSDLNYY